MDLVIKMCVRHPGLAVDMENQIGEHPSQRKLFVRQLAYETTTETLTQVFQAFGEIEEAVVMVDKVANRSKGYGFVTFRTAAGAKAALHEPFKVIDGRRTETILAGLGRNQLEHKAASGGGGGGGSGISGGGGGAGAGVHPAMAPNPFLDPRFAAVAAALLPHHPAFARMTAAAAPATTAPVTAPTPASYHSGGARKGYLGHGNHHGGLPAHAARGAPSPPPPPMLPHVPVYGSYSMAPATVSYPLPSVRD
jgi:hypothetical protein